MHWWSFRVRCSLPPWVTFGMIDHRSKVRLTNNLTRASCHWYRASTFLSIYCMWQISARLHCTPNISRNKLWWTIFSTSSTCIWTTSIRSITSWSKTKCFTPSWPWRGSDSKKTRVLFTLLSLSHFANSSRLKRHLSRYGKRGTRHIAQHMPSLMPRRLKLRESIYIRFDDRN